VRILNFGLSLAARKSGVGG